MHAVAVDDLVQGCAGFKRIAECEFSEPRFFVLVMGTAFTVTNHEPSMCPQTRTASRILEGVLLPRPNPVAGRLSSRNRAFGYCPPHCHWQRIRGGQSPDS